MNTALELYPDAQEILRKKARSLMRKNAAREREEKRKERILPEPEVVISNPEEPNAPPKLLQAVIQVNSFRTSWYLESYEFVIFCKNFLRHLGSVMSTYIIEVTIYFNDVGRLQLRFINHLSYSMF